jgi:hypothetical protein
MLRGGHDSMCTFAVASAAAFRAAAYRAAALTTATPIAITADRLLRL